MPGYQRKDWRQSESNPGPPWLELIAILIIPEIRSYRSVGPLLSAVLSGPAPELSLSCGLDVDRVDDVEELLHHGHLLVDEVDLAVDGLKPIRSWWHKDRPEGGGHSTEVAFVLLTHLPRVWFSAFLKFIIWIYFLCCWDCSLLRTVDIGLIILIEPLKYF